MSKMDSSYILQFAFHNIRMQSLVGLQKSCEIIKLLETRQKPMNTKLTVKMISGTV